jgi:hypothetical protein
MFDCKVREFAPEWDGHTPAQAIEHIGKLKTQEPRVMTLEVVRCKDCIYWKSDMLTHFWKPCDVVSTDKDWYCPCGKRR